MNIDAEAASVLSYEVNEPDIPSQPHLPDSSASIADCNLGQVSLGHEFKYKLLDPKKNEIHLLRLFPGSQTSPIRGSLSHVSVGDNPLYGALSYEWGDRNNPEAMILDNTKFAITKNLKTTLLRLRSKTFG